MKDIPWSLILGSLPSIAALLKVFTPTGERGLARRVGRLTDIRAKVPEAAQDPIDATLTRLSSELAFQEDQRARRTIDSGVFWTIVSIGAVGFVGTYLLWRDPLIWRILAVLLASFATLLILAGGVPQLMKVRPKFGYEEAAEKATTETT